MNKTDISQIHDLLLELLQKAPPEVTLQELQQELWRSSVVQRFLGMISRENLSALFLERNKTRPNHDEDFLQLELLKFFYSNDVTNPLHHLSCLSVPFERVLNKKLSDNDLLTIATSDRQEQRQTFPLRLVLENLRSEFNVGSIFRSAECFGAEQIALCGYTPLPQKTDMGTKKSVPHQSVSLQEALLDAEKNQFQIIALETVVNSKKLHQITFDEKVCFVLGNERHGLLPSTIQQCHEVVQIPLLGNKNSLNVGTAASLALYEYHRNRGSL